MSHPSTWSLLTRQQIDRAADRLGIMDATDGITKGMLAKALMECCFPEIVTHGAGTFDLTTSDFGKLHLSTSATAVTYTLTDAVQGDVIWIGRTGASGTISVITSQGAVEIPIGGASPPSTTGLKLNTPGAMIGLRYEEVAVTARWLCFSSYGTILLI